MYNHIKDIGAVQNMSMKLGLVEFIESAHKVGEGTLHGHNFKVEVIVKGEYAGGKMDFHKLRDIVKEEIKKLDHIILNEVIEVPVVENIAKYIAKRLKDKLPLDTIRVWETQDRFCELKIEEYESQ